MVRRLTFGRPFTLLVIATLSFIARPVAAQTVAENVTVINQPGRVPYQYSVDRTGGTFLNCTTMQCHFHFPIVPAGKRLVVQHVSLRLEAEFATDFEVALGAVSAAALHLGTVEANSPFLTVSMHTPVTYYVEAKSEPMIGILGRFPGTFRNGTATLVGYLMDKK